MEYRNLGACGLKVSPICLGTAFRGEPGEEVCRAVIERAIHGGINFIDCANQYQDGRSEEILGKAIKGRRDRVVLTSKVCHHVGPGPNDGGLSRLHIMREAENTLARLKTDHLDIYIAHDDDPSTPLEEALRAFDDLVRQGKVRYAGCSNLAPQRVCEALWASERRNLERFVCAQNEYNLLCRGVERELVPLCVSEGLGVMAYSALGVGLLTGRFRRGEPPVPGTFWAERPRHYERVMTPEAWRAVETVTAIAAERGKTPAQVALAWLVSKPGVSAAIVGPDSPEQVEDALGAVGWELSVQEMETLDRVSAWAV